ncbi:MAG: S8 family serine peptidase [Planctomycetota bacterium]
MSRAARHVLLLGLALALAACGGGAGAQPGGTPEPEGPLDGLRGVVLRQDVHLGRIAEMEPNDTPGQPCRVAALPPGCRVEVAGTVALTPATWGAADALDVFRVSSLVDQDVELSLSFATDDADGLGTNELSLELLDATGQIVIDGDQGGTPPLVLSTTLTAGSPVFVRVSIVTGHAWYVVGLEGTGTPAPLSAKALAAASPAAAVQAPPTVAAPPDGESLAGERCSHHHVLAGFVEGADPQRVAAEVGASLGRRLGGGGWCVHLDAADCAHGEDAVMALLERLEAHPEVRFAEPDYVLAPLGGTLDERFAEQWNLQVIGAPAAWDITRGSPDVVIGVVDSGIIDHPDLAGRVVAGYDFISSTSISADGNGRDADPTDMGDQLMPSGLSTWHGTHVASIAVGGQGAAGISGVAPICRVLPLRVVGRGGGLVSDGADAILFAAGLLTTADGRRLAEPLRVVNLSLGSAIDSQVLEDACQQAADAGVLLIAAVGNNGSSQVLYPARYPSVMGVAAVDRTLISTAYSNFGTEVEIAAPGGNTNADRAGSGWSEGILGAVRDQTTEPSAAGHLRIMGTSQAAPHVAAAAALVMSVDPTLTAAEVRALLRATARDLTPLGDDVGTGSGLVQVGAAVQRAFTDLGNVDVRPPALGLGWDSVRLSGLEDRVTVPLANFGGGRLDLGMPTAITEDGADWLYGVPVLPNLPTAVISHAGLEVIVIRSQIPAGPSWVSGVIAVRNSVGVPIGRIQVSVARGVLLRQGADLGVTAFDAASGGSLVARTGRACADFDYRWWFTDFDPGMFNVRAGEDIDRDGFFCEPSDACGWWGGPTLGDATDLGVVPDEPAGAPGTITLVPPP